MKNLTKYHTLSTTEAEAVQGGNIWTKIGTYVLEEAGSHIDDIVRGYKKGYKRHVGR
jgi:hypothetical protein